MFPAQRSQYLQPILDFPTVEQDTPISPVAYQGTLGQPATPADSLSLIEPGNEVDWIEPTYSRRAFPDHVYDRPLGDVVDTTPYEWTLLPAGPIYKSYMAGVKESRLSAHLMKITDDNWMLDGTLGGRFGVMRWGRDSATGFLAEGVQWDIEGSAQVRLDIPEEVDVRSVDFRAGTQLTWSYADNPAHRSRFGYYHLSSHLGDEFLLKNPTYPRLNYAHDLLIFGHSYYFTPKLRVYGEVGWAFYHLVADPWEFQFGVEWAPTRATGFWGEPFLAVGCHLREEVNFGGSFVVQTGWAWVGEIPGRTFRMGLHYHNGDSTQNSFYNNFEQQIGFGIWYDF
ncbi:DUF1207 domain-containing protein [Blastopirellula marina]|uniref:DUF1207 domain-containing protein n=1 Tax=Blastopirellula marina TaxID=124 RepID=A0A2S8G2G9_9BACT|nr:DUF1207 domain-containing protein [Blastopirellula marina]PQO38652.1 DUF1207 domain-containing protein [Blastopirellula marina]PTL45309.1 DUF1207 domain-containing protein [Blastopirellula marina]